MQVSFSTFSKSTANVIIGVLFGCTADKNTALDSGEITESVNPTWEVLESFDQTGAWLRAHVPPDTPETLWLIGGQPAEGAIKRGNAITGFETVELPTDTPLLNWADGSSDNLWVGGLNGTILHWNGSEWSDRSIEIPEAIWGLTVNKETGTVVAVGGLSRWGGENAIAYRYDNNEWFPLALPTELDELSNLFKVAYDGSNYWMVGSSGAVIYGSLDSLTAVPTGLTQDLITVLSSPAASSVHIVGGRGTGLYTTGNTGDLEPPVQFIAGINGIAMDANSHGLLVGEMGYGAFLSNDGSVLYEPSPATTHILHAGAVHSVGGKQYWYAVGGNLGTAESTFEGSILTMEWAP